MDRGRPHGRGLPPPRWAVPDLLPEGLTLLAGAPKLGKSWLSLNLSVAIASGGVALGSIPVTKATCCISPSRTPAGRLPSRLRWCSTAHPHPPGSPSRRVPAVARRGRERITDWLDAPARPAHWSWSTCSPASAARAARNADKYEADYRAVARPQGDSRSSTASRCSWCTTPARPTPRTTSTPCRATNGLAGAADGVGDPRPVRGRSGGRAQSDRPRRDRDGPRPRLRAAPPAPGRCSTAPRPTTCNPSSADRYSPTSRDARRRRHRRPSRTRRETATTW